MASSQPDTSGENDSSSKNNGDLLDEYGKETYTLLKYVLHEMATEPKKGDEKELPLQRALRYTGLPISTLEALAHNDSIKIDNISEINRKQVHDALMAYYLDVFLVPTSSDLFNSLQQALPPYEDIRSFRRKLVKMGYIFKKKADSFVVYEKPSIRFERFLYLKNIVQYREKKRPIYYLSHLGVSYNKFWNVHDKMLQKNERQYLFYFAVSSLTGVQFITKVPHFDKINFNSWVLHEVIPNLEVNSVVILDNTKYHCDKYCEPPKKTSPSNIMIDWLTFHDIPYQDTMSTVELFTLAEKYTDLHIKTYKVDVWIKHNNHDVLRLPDCINELTPATQVRHLISKKLEGKATPLTKPLKEIVREIGLPELERYNAALIIEETRLFKTELKLDKILDYLKPSSSVEKDLYLPSFSDSD